jgi:hypothetical protein
VFARSATDSWSAAQIAREERDHRAGTRQHRNCEYGGIVQHPSRREGGRGRRVKINPGIGGGRHPKGHADDAPGRAALGRDGWVSHGGKSGGNNNVVAEEELARSVISVGFEWIRELKKC